MQIYKPNAKMSGSACSLNYNNYSESLYIEMIKQASWDDTKKRGTFDKENKLLAKFNPNEIGAMLDVLNRNTEWKIFHNSDKGSTSGSFSPYKNQSNVQMGYSLSLYQKDANDANNTRSVRIGFTFAEAEVLKQFFIACLQDYSRKLIKRTEDYSKKKYLENKGNVQPQNTPKDEALDWSDMVNDSGSANNPPKFNNGNSVVDNDDLF